MSAVFFHNAGELKTSGKQLSTTSATAIFAALPNDAVEIGLIRISEVAGSTASVILDIYNGAAVVSKIRGAKPMAANDSEIIDGPLILEPGYTLRATASAANDIHVTVTYLVIKT